MTEPTSTQTCPACGATVAGEARACGHCAAPLDPTVALREPPKGKWYHNIWGVLAILFFFLGPFGLPLVWNNPRFSRRLKIGLTVVTTAYTAWLVDLTMRVIKAVTEGVNQFNSTLTF